MICLSLSLLLLLLLCVCVFVCLFIVCLLYDGVCCRLFVYRSCLFFPPQKSLDMFVDSGCIVSLLMIIVFVFLLSLCVCLCLVFSPRRAWICLSSRASAYETRMNDIVVQDRTTLRARFARVRHTCILACTHACMIVHDWRAL